MANTVYIITNTGEIVKTSVVGSRHTIYGDDVVMQLGTGDTVFKSQQGTHWWTNRREANNVLNNTYLY
ncbi:MAG: hypothetical protein IJ593_05925 [Lachnospiraceae bacterium]|nr:hypothetical protein [Lachnospiraceae bacterium]